MSQNNKEFSDPKIQLMLSIQRHDDYITECLERLDESGLNGGFHKEITRAALAMALLLRRLSLSDSDKEMIVLRNNITLRNYDQVDSNYVLDAYAIIHNFLNATYYAGFRPPMGESFFKELEGDNSE